MLSRGPAEKRLRLYVTAILGLILVASFYWSRYSSSSSSSSNGIIHDDATDTTHPSSKASTATLPPPPQPDLDPSAATLPPPPPPVSNPDAANLHVVIAYYEEEPYWINTWLDDLRAIPAAQQLGLYITIYTKGTTRDPATIQAATGAHEVIQLPNTGREGATYLHHILTHWDTLPAYTLFTQAYLKKAQQTAGPGTGHLTDWLVDRLTQHLPPPPGSSDTPTPPPPSNATAKGPIGFMSLDRKHDICHCGHCTDMGHDDIYPLWPPLYTLITGRLCHLPSPSSKKKGLPLPSPDSTSSSSEIPADTSTILSFNAHFLVSRTRIRARPRTLYTYLLDLITAGPTHWIHAEREPSWVDRARGASKPSDPKFGHTLERLWHTIFACDDVRDVEDCDVSRFGMEEEGRGGCSCRDAAPLV